MATKVKSPKSPRAKKTITKEPEQVSAPTIKTEKQELEELYALMKKYAVNSIGDVEVKLSRF